MSFHLQQDTICAIATPVGQGGIGIIKISGPEALALGERLFRSSHVQASEPSSLLSFRSHKLYHGQIIDPATNIPVDEVLLSVMRAPHTYTREDVVEINAHSGYAALDRILQLVLDQGARLAEPGEFTRRAFLNGRIDLSQAEAVIELIHARSEQSLLQANRQLRGELRHQVEAWRERLLHCQSILEATIDFSEDLDDEAPPLSALVEELREPLLLPLQRLLDQYRSGRILREGLTLVLAGKPNVGKSSLLNALTGRDRAIVTPIPGTTRDVVEDSFSLAGVLVRVLDTAGIRARPDMIESLGIERTLRSVEEADVVLWVVDRSQPLTEEDDEVFQRIASRQYIVLLNKSDLPEAVPIEEVHHRYRINTSLLSLAAVVPQDVERLRSFLTERFIRQTLEGTGAGLVPNLRQKESLGEAAAALDRAFELIADGLFGELVCLELETARRALDSLLGLEAGEEVLDRIFSQFCIGK